LASTSGRRQGRRDPLRAAVVLWGSWWLVLAVFFSAGTYLNSYYVAALVPAVASGREVLPIGGYLGNVPAPALAMLRADIRRGYVRALVLPVSPPGPDPRVRWLESHCTRRPQPPRRRPVPYATFFCGPGPGPQPSPSPAGPASGAPSPAPP
jgi:hypothetical protein